MAEEVQARCKLQEDGARNFVARFHERHDARRPAQYAIQANAPIYGISTDDSTVVPLHQNKA
jgi:hypothetical protein